MYRNFSLTQSLILQKFIEPFLKDVGHSIYSYAESLLDEEEYIDHAGLVIMRHMIGEVSFFYLLIWGIEEKNRMLGANVRHS